MAKYVNLAKVTSNYAMKMNQLSNRIFGEVARPTNSRSMKVVTLFSQKPINKRSEIVEYYPRHPQIGWLMRHLRAYGLYRDEHQDFKDEFERLRILRGKGKSRLGRAKRKRGV